jgi:REP element-mobilizing transposase RayT
VVFYSLSKIKGTIKMRYTVQHQLALIPKNHIDKFNAKITGLLQEVLSSIAGEQRLTFDRIEVTPGLAHIVVEAPLIYSPAQIAQMLKDKTERTIFERFPEMRWLLPVKIKCESCRIRSIETNVIVS